MKRLLFWAFAAFIFAACTEIINEQDLQPIVDDAPESFTVGFEENDTRVQLNEATKTVWTKDDLVSVFYRSNANQKWQYQGETGERVGNLKRLENGSGTTKTTKTVVVYPYSENYWLNTDSYAIDANLPATQYYTEDSYGVGCNLMVSQSEFTQFSLKSVCGWLKLQLTGNGEVVKSIKFRGNNDEQVAGLIYVDTDTAESTLASEMGSSDDNNVGGNLNFDDTILTEVTLDCSAGITLGAESTAFYIALPPQTFTEGFTVEVNCLGYKPMTISTSKKVVIERNHIQPMAAVEHEAEKKIPDNEIWYTSSDGNIVTPYHTYSYVFGTDIVSNTYENGQGIITFDGCVTNIGDWAFYDCNSLTSVTIPDSVTEIGFGAFYDCSSLTNVTMGNSVTTIGENAFQYCSSLTSVTIPDCVTSIGRCAFCDCSSLTSVAIPDCVTTIGELAFYGCSNLLTVTIPDNVTTIERAAFSDCSSLATVIIGDSITTIVEATFQNCSCLTSVTIPDSVTTIGECSFADCSSLATVTIPNCVTSIETCAFFDCSSLTSVYCKPTTPPAGGSGIFGLNASDRKIYVPIASVEAYKSASGWSDYADYIEGYDF